MEKKPERLPLCEEMQFQISIFDPLEPSSHTHLLAYLHTSRRSGIRDDGHRVLVRGHHGGGGGCVTQTEEGAMVGMAKHRELTGSVGHHDGAIDGAG